MPENRVSPKLLMEYHPMIKKVVPPPIIKISQDYSVNQYLLMFILIAVGMGALFLAGIVVTKMIE